jgi:hypothetical protein
MANMDPDTKNWKEEDIKYLLGKYLGVKKKPDIVPNKKRKRRRDKDKIAEIKERSKYIVIVDDDDIIDTCKNRKYIRKIENNGTNSYRHYSLFYLTTKIIQINLL